MPKRKISTRDIPQADTLSYVVDVVDFVSQGHITYQAIAKRLGLTGRQGRYYRRAAEILGFIRNIPHHNISILTDLGKSFLSAKPSQQKEILLERALDVPVIETVMGMISASERPVTQRELEETLSKVVKGSTTKMVQRRLQTILSWLETLDVIRKSGNKIRFRKLPESIEKIEIDDPAVPVFPRVDDLKLFEDVAIRTGLLKEKIRFEVDAVKRERASVMHEKLRSILARKIRGYGFVPTFNHFIDLAVCIENTHFIFEVKTSDANAHRQVRKAISQLYEYRYIQSLPKARLVLLIENPLTGKNRWLLDYLEQDRGIFVIWDGTNEDLFTTENGLRALPFME